MHIQFAELPVFDQDSAKAFYTRHLACQVAAIQKDFELTRTSAAAPPASQVAGKP